MSVRIDLDNWTEITTPGLPPGAWLVMADDGRVSVATSHNETRTTGAGEEAVTTTETVYLHAYTGKPLAFTPVRYYDVPFSEVLRGK